MQFEEFTFQGQDNFTLSAYKWLPDDKQNIVAVLQISHGMAEHARRYEPLARFLVDHGIAVYGHDHRGHGKTVKNQGVVGFFCYELGWQKAAKDIHHLTEYIKRDLPQSRRYLLGHSMGSMLARSYIEAYSGDIHGAIFSGTAYDPGLLGQIGVLVSKLEGRMRGLAQASPVLEYLSFGQFNRRIERPVTKFDWLSRNPQEVQKYLNDPLCGALSTSGFYQDMLGGLRQIHSKQHFAKIPKDLPLYIFSGSEDPVGGYQAGVQKVIAAYERAGVVDLTAKIYPGGRHEMLNEINRGEVFQDLLRWIRERLK